MELILLSLFGIASLFALQFLGLFYERWLSEPFLTRSEESSGSQLDEPLASELSYSEAANDAYTTTIVRVRSLHAKY